MRESPTLPPEIVALQEGPDEIRYRLPRRSLPGGRWLGLAALLGGAIIVGCTAWTIYTIAASFLDLPLPRWAGVRGVAFFFTIFFAFTTRGGLLPLWWGLALLWGQREIEVNNDYLRTIERCGPLWRSRRWKVEAIESLEVRPITNKVENASHAWMERAAQYHALDLHPRTGRRGVLAWGYPAPLLAPLAQILAARCERSAEMKSFAEAVRAPRTPIQVFGAGLAPLAKPVGRGDSLAEDEIDAEEIDDEEFDEEEFGRDEIDPSLPVAPPSETTIQFERLDQGEFTITVPPAGVWKGSKGLFFFSLIWCGFMMVFTSFFVAAGFNGKGKEGLPLLVLGIIGLFWVAGVGMFLSALNMGRRRAAIALVGGRLMAIQSGLFGSKKRDWPLAEVSDIKVGPSGLEINNKPVLELQIHGPGGAKFGLLSERDDDELRWLAWEIRQAMPQRPTAADAN